MLIFAYTLIESVFESVHSIVHSIGKLPDELNKYLRIKFNTWTNL